VVICFGATSNWRRKVESSVAPSSNELQGVRADGDYATRLRSFGRGPITSSLKIADRLPDGLQQLIFSQMQKMRLQLDLTGAEVLNSHVREIYWIARTASVRGATPLLPSSYRVLARP
jgi:hypothetical protein